MAGLPVGLRTVHHDLQSVQPLEPQGAVDADLHSPVSALRLARRSQYRQYRRSGAPFGPWRKRGAQVQSIGRSRGGPTTKIHALTDACGRAFVLSPGNSADISAAPKLLSLLPPPKRLLADKGYDANSLRSRLAETATEAVIPSTRSRKTPIPYDKKAYRNRNRIERAFCRLKDWRRIATRYDKLANNFASAVAIAAAIIWWT